MVKLKHNERVRTVLDKIRGGMRVINKVLLKSFGHKRIRLFDCYSPRFLLAVILKIV